MESLGVKDLTSLQVGVNGTVFVLPLGKSLDTSDFTYLAELSDSFVRKIASRCACSWYSVHGSKVILDEGPARIFELVYKKPYLTDSAWEFLRVGTVGCLKLEPAVVNNVNIDSSASGPRPPKPPKEPKAAPDEVKLSGIL